MKKSLLCGFLAFAMLLGCFVALPSASAAEQDGRQDADYAALYVGDGLVRRFDAYDPQNGTVDLANGKWYSTDGVASVSLKTPSSVKLWKARTKGIGYDVQSYDAWDSYKSRVGIDLGIANLPAGDFTVEYVMTHDGIVDANGNDVAFNSTSGYGWWNNDFSGWMFGSLHFIHFMYSLTPNGISLQYRAMYSQNGSYATTNYANCIGDVLPFPDTELHRPHSLSMTFDHTAAAASGGSYDKAVYNWSCDLRQFFTFDNQTTTKAYNQAYKPNSEGYFRLMYDFPGTVYEIRIYEKALSDKERQQNYFVDLCRQAGASVKGVASLSADAKENLFSAAAKLSLGDGEANRATLENMILIATRDTAEYEALYVKNGLVLCFDAYNPYSDAVDLAAGKWTSTDGSATATLANASLWSASEGGGIGYGFTSYSQWAAQYTQTGLDLGIANLPTGDFTVEFAVSMDGIVDAAGKDVYHTAESGNAYGWYTKNKTTWMFGTFHFLQFLPSSAPSGSTLGIRGIYSAAGTYNDKDFGDTQAIFPDSALHTVQSFSMTFDHTAAHGGKSYDEASYSLYRNGNSLYQFSNYTTTVSAFQCYLPNSTGAFRLMYGFPGTVYQVRIYNRVLSEAERQQNHFVDLARAFDVSVAGVAELSAEKKATLFRATAGLGTENGEADRAKLEAFIAFYTGAPEKLIHLAVGYEGLSVRLDTAGIRATFVVDDSVRRVLSTRYTVRYGAIMAWEQEGIAISSDLTVTAKDGRFVPNAGSAVTVYSDKGDFGATGLFLERDGDLARFAYTVLYDNVGLDKEYLTRGMLWRGFCALEDENGAIAVYYVDAEGEIFGGEDAMYGTSTTMQEAADYFVNRYGTGSVAELYRVNRSEALRGVLSRCGGEVIDYYPGRQAATKLTYTVDPTVPMSGNGTAGRPFRTLAEAFAAAKTAFGRYENVSVTVVLKNGTHRVTDTLTLSGADIAAADYWFTVVGGEDAVLSGNALLSPSFTKVAGKNYYVAQLDKVGGAYPDFRYLTVNGELADLAYHGYRRYETMKAEGGSMWSTGALAHVDGCTAAAGTVCAQKCNKMYMDAGMLSGVSAESLVGAEVHMAVEWEFKVVRILRVDTSDKDKDGRIAVYFEAAPFAEILKDNLTWSNRYFWMENALAFVDAPGEYYYDRAQGKLYYYPKAGENIASSTFEYPLVEQVLNFSELKNLTLDGFTVTGSDNRYLETNGAYGGGQAGSTAARGWHTQSAIFAKSLKDSALINLTVKNVAGDGVQMRGANEGVDVDSCRFYNVGATAIRMGNGNAYTEADHLLDSRIVNNVIDGAAWFFRQNCALYISVAKNVSVSHNTIRNCSYSAISIGWRWSSTTSNPESGYCNLYNVEVAYNFIERFMTDMSDGGGVYTLGGNANNEDYRDKYFNFLHHNRVIVDANTGAGKGRFMPLYHDGASSNWHSHTNVVETYRGNSGLGSFYVQYALGANDVDPVTGLASLASQQTNNVLLENNYFLWCDWTVAESINKGSPYQASNAEDYMVSVIFWNHVRNNHHVYQRNNHLVPTEEYVSEECRETMDQAGSTLYTKE